MSETQRDSRACRTLHNIYEYVHSLAKTLFHASHLYPEHDVQSSAREAAEEGRAGEEHARVVDACAGRQAARGAFGALVLPPPASARVKS